MDISLYALTVLLWGTSWLAVKFQLGVVMPEVSLVYRFALAGAIMLALCLIGRRRMRFSRTDHLFFTLQGTCLFSTNYFFVYLGTQHLTTGLVAVVFSLVVVFNIMGSRILFGTPFRLAVVAGAALGLAGIALVFWPELKAFDPSRQSTIGALQALVGTAIAALGMLTSAWNQQRRALPVLQSNAYGMLYGTILLTALTFARGSPFAFDPTFAYTASLLYLSVFATVLAFWSYLTLVGRIGAERAAYATVLFPIIALALSTWVEGFVWTATAALGIALVLAGNVLILRKPGG